MCALHSRCQSTLLAAVCAPALLAGALVAQDRDSFPPYPQLPWAENYFYAYDRAAAAAGLKPLRAQPLPAGRREVRIWTEVELFVPKTLYRFVERHGRIDGEQILYWRAGEPDTAAGERLGETMDDLLRYSLVGHCDRFTVRAETGVCWTRFASPPDWKRVLRRAAEQGLWELPDPAMLPDDSIIGVDGWTITVELRDGAFYRTYRYNTPEAHPKWPSAAHATAIAKTLGAIDSVAAPSRVHRVFRGRTTGRYQSAFLPCGDKVPVELRADVASEAKRKGLPMPDTAVVGPDLYVEVFGELSPEWLARQWQSRFPRVLQVFELRRVQRWNERACAAPAAAER